MEGLDYRVDGQGWKQLRVEIRSNIEIKQAMALNASDLRVFVRGRKDIDSFGCRSVLVYHLIDPVNLKVEL